MLAAAAVGMHPTLEEATAAMSRVGERFAPGAAAPRYEELYREVYRPLYPALAPVLGALARFQEGA
jgi:xylulokinase